MRTVNPPLVSCLCVTENRQAFLPWLLRCYDSQTWPCRELVVIDSSHKPFIIAGCEDIRVFNEPPGTGVACKRNRALQEARGEIVTWFDDDDWQHPNKLLWLVETLSNGALYAGCRKSWFVDLFHGRCKKHPGVSGRILFNSAGFVRNAVKNIRFKENVPKGSDTYWMRDIERSLGHIGKHIIDDKIFFFWLCHEENLSNPAHRRRFNEPLSILKTRLGVESWGDTDEALTLLKSRLNCIKPETRVEAKMNDEEIVLLNSPLEKRNEKNSDDVSVMIKATVMDAPYLDVMTRHMISQAKFPFQEKVVVVDRQPAFTGKYRTRSRASDESLNQVLETLKNDRIIDRVVDVDMSSSVVDHIMQRYFDRYSVNVPTHACTGGPIYATLFGMENVGSDYVLQMDADLFFYTSGKSWVSEALTKLKNDPAIWLMMTHPGPPAGSAGRSLSSYNKRLAKWDGEIDVWRFSTATTRYFLCDRRKLYRRLRPIDRDGGCAPLEQCLSRALQENQAFRGALGNLESWHLHAWSHADPFPKWATALATAIEEGSYPDFQRGEYDLRLDRAKDREAWGKLLNCERSDQFPYYEESSEASGYKEIIQTIETANSIENRVSSGERKTALSETQIACKPSSEGMAPLGVIIPIRNRAGQRVRNALRSLNWQSAGRPQEIVLVSHGSRPEIDKELKQICQEQGASLLSIGTPSDQWNKPLALNVGIQATSPEIPFLMTMDADMILAPNFLTIVLQKLSKRSPAFVLCRSSDLPQHVLLPDNPERLRNSLGELSTKANLRGRYGTGGIQAANRSFFFEVRGYDEDLVWWGGMDGDMVQRALLSGLSIEWIEDRTVMYHQWHPSKHRCLKDTDEITQAKLAWKNNSVLVRKRQADVLRNLKGWGGGPVIDLYSS